MPSITTDPGLKNHNASVNKAPAATYAAFVAAPGPTPAALLVGATRDAVPPPGLIRQINSVLVLANTFYRI